MDYHFIRRVCLRYSNEFDWHPSGDDMEGGFFATMPGATIDVRVGPDAMRPVTGCRLGVSATITKYGHAWRTGKWSETLDAIMGVRKEARMGRLHLKGLLSWRPGFGNNLRARVEFYRVNPGVRLVRLGEKGWEDDRFGDTMCPRLANVVEWLGGCSRTADFVDFLRRDLLDANLVGGWDREEIVRTALAQPLEDHAGNPAYETMCA